MNNDTHLYIKFFFNFSTELDKLIGVHCTHGCNRTGLMICTYLVSNSNFSAEKAIESKLNCLFLNIFLIINTVFRFSNSQGT